MTLAPGRRIETGQQETGNRDPANGGRDQGCKHIPPTFRLVSAAKCFQICESGSLQFSVLGPRLPGFDTTLHLRGPFSDTLPRGGDWPPRWVGGSPP